MSDKFHGDGPKPGHRGHDHDDGPLDASRSPEIQPSDHTAGYGDGSRGKAWGRPLVVIDKIWTKFEVWLCTIVILLEIVALFLWVSLKGMSTDDGSSPAGLVFRAVVGAVVLGTLGYWIPFKAKAVIRHTLSVTGVVLGVALARVWGDVGAGWSANMLNWFQQASTITMLGGLRGVATRLTLLLALLGGSLATAAGKHITIDLISRYLRPSIRFPLAIAVWVLSSVICFASAWGFFDHIAIENFEARANMTAAEKASTITHGLKEYTFITAKQLQLDAKSLPHVLRGESYQNWLRGAEWNHFLDTSGFVERYGQERVDRLKIPPEGKRSPMVSIPGRGEPRGVLTDAANLVFPIGLLIIAVRFLLLSLLTISGHMELEGERETVGPSSPNDGAVEGKV
jgi:hypothetical protein